MQLSAGAAKLFNDVLKRFQSNKDMEVAVNHFAPMQPLSSLSHSVSVAFGTWCAGDHRWWHVPEKRPLIFRTGGVLSTMVRSVGTGTRWRKGDMQR